MTTARSPGERAPELLARLEDTRRRFEGWRTTRPTKGCRIPPELWAAAARCAGEYGVHRTAQVLGLDGGKLKRKMSPATGRAKRGSPAFVELVPASRLSAAECVVEIDNRAGSRLRIHLKGAALPDLVDLARSFAREGA
jgi:hypothetical protein